MAALLGQICRGEIDGDAPSRERQTRGDQCGPHPLPRLGNGLVRQANDIECGKAGRDLDLDIDRAGFDTLEGDGCDPLDHSCPCLWSESLA